ncbi:MAG: phosphoribosylamine--glycine ligase [bacterium]
MKILVVGKGGREHAIAWRLARCQSVEKVWIAPGNAGTSAVGENHHLKSLDEWILFAKENNAGYIFVGPEDPLVEGIADEAKAFGVKVFGPSRAGAQLEGSKVFAKDFLQRHKIPTAWHRSFDSAEEAARFADSRGYPLVIKADGLASGKGVFIVHSQAECRRTIDDLMVHKSLGEAGRRIVMEEFLQGEEGSFFALIATGPGGAISVTCPISQDHKRLLDNDEGPNTGGMGAYAPVDHLSVNTQIVKGKILAPTLEGLQKDGIDYCGVLYIGLMFTPEGPKVLEFNVRWGDPEAEVLLPLMKSDLAEIASALIEGQKPPPLEWEKGYAVDVVLASDGYPHAPKKGSVITGIEDASKIAPVFHSGTALRDHYLIASGGRILNVVGTGSTLKEARDRAYEAVYKIHYDTKIYRTDIGHHALSRAASPAPKSKPRP